MASLIIAAGALTYDRIQTHRAQKAQKKEYNQARFAELQKDNEERVSKLPTTAPTTAPTNPSVVTTTDREYNTVDAEQQRRRSLEEVEERINSVEPPTYNSLSDGKMGTVGKEKRGFKGFLKREKEGGKPMAKEYNVVR
ncbi:MAG: hypothetical protein M1812_002393 [Candelaria pacifica]|nr:MAG: hypothetical protein M1812_002393 [Candelaria pacifica]